MNRKALIIILGVAILFIIAAIMVFVRSDNMEDAPFFVETATTTAVETRPTPAAFETEKIREKYYTIDLEYPKNSPTERAEIGTYIDTLRREFLTAVPKTDEEAEYIGLGGGRIYQLQTKATVYTSSSTITYKLETYTDTGGAHGATIDATFTYDREGKLVEISDLFSSGELSTISTAARTYFYKKLGDQVTKSEIDTGTEPKERNFSTWYLTDNKITFIFQQYQIGPYVIGIQEFPYMLMR